MPRINVETSLWTDPRFQRLLIQVGNRHEAMGMVVELWTLAQHSWCPDKAPIPTATWESLQMPDALIECGLAERQDSGIYAKGSERHFAWWFERQEAGRRGGLKSAEARRSKALAKLDLTQANSSKRKQIEPSSSSSSSSSKERKVVDPTDTTKLWKYYSERIKAKGIEPIHEGAKTNKICQSLVRSHTLEGAYALVDLYLNDSSAYIADKAWALPLLPSQQQRLLANAHKSSSNQLLTFGSD